MPSSVLLREHIIIRIYCKKSLQKTLDPQPNPQEAEESGNDKERLQKSALHIVLDTKCCQARVP